MSPGTSIHDLDESAPPIERTPMDPKVTFQPASRLPHDLDGVGTGPRTCLFRVSVTPEGSPTNAELLVCEPAFVAVAYELLGEFRFSPATDHAGNPVPGSIEVTIDFVVRREDLDAARVRPSLRVAVSAGLPYLPWPAAEHFFQAGEITAAVGLSPMPWGHVGVVIGARGNGLLVQSEAIYSGKWDYTLHTTIGVRAGLATDSHELGRYFCAAVPMSAELRLGHTPGRVALSTIPELDVSAYNVSGRLMAELGVAFVVGGDAGR